MTALNCPVVADTLPTVLPVTRPEYPGGIFNAIGTETMAELETADCPIPVALCNNGPLTCTLAAKSAANATMLKLFPANARCKCLVVVQILKMRIRTK